MNSLTIAKEVKNGVLESKVVIAKAAKLNWCGPIPHIPSSSPRDIAPG